MTTQGATTSGTWLTQDAYDRLKAELAGLVNPRAAGSDEQEWSEADRDAAETAVERERRTARIRQLQDILATASVGQPPDDGVAEPGMVLTVRFADDTSTETFLMADREEGARGELEVYSVRSPLGAALLGAVPGEQRQYQLPRGGTMSVTLVSAVPYS